MLSDPSPAEREILGANPYQPNEAVLHTDVRMLPRRRAAWASWNYHLLAHRHGRSAVTYHMNRLQSLHAGQELCVTLNRTEAIDPSTIIRTIAYAHPVYTSGERRRNAASGDQRRQPHPLLRRLLGVGVHEDGVNSALRVARHFGARL